MSDDDKKERARRRRVETARELEGRGFLEQAVREYVKAKAPEEAARALASVGRLADAANAILEALGIEAGEAGSAPAEHRGVLEQAAVFFQQTGDSTRAQAIRDALGSPPAPPPTAAPSQGASAAPETPRASPSPPSSPVSPPSSSSPPKMPGFASKPAFRPPAGAPAGSFRPPAPAATEGGRPLGSFRPPSPSPGGSGSVRPAAGFRAPSRAPSAAPPPSGSRSPAREPSSPAASPVATRSAPPSPAASLSGSPAASPPARAASSQPAPLRSSVAPIHAPSASPPAPEARLSASGEVVTEHTGSREAGWRDASSSSIDESIRQMLDSGRKGAAARVAWDAGRHEQALEWFRELDLHYQAGACLRALGRMEEAIEALLRVPADGPHYRRACFELVPAAAALSRLDFEIDRFFGRFVEQGPQDVSEIPTFLELAELYRQGEFAQGASRCVSKVLALDGKHEGALAMRAQLKARSDRPRPSAAPALQRGLPELPTLEEFRALARANAPAE